MNNNLFTFFTGLAFTAFITMLIILDHDSLLERLQQPKYKVYYEYKINHQYLTIEENEAIELKIDTIPVDTIYVKF